MLQAVEWNLSRVVFALSAAENFDRVLFFTLDPMESGDFWAPWRLQVGGRRDPVRIRKLPL